MASNHEEIDHWNTLIEQSRFSQNNKNILTEYIANLTSKGLPVIWNLRHLAYILEIKRQVLGSMVNSTNSFYREFTIPKRRGGERSLSAPFPLLLEAQRWILENLLSQIEVSSSAHGFVKGRSIVTNAKEHLGQDYLLKLDLKDFFPSISINRVISIFQNQGYVHGVAFYLSRLCCLNNSLPQ